MLTKSLIIMVGVDVRVILQVICNGKAKGSQKVCGTDVIGIMGENEFFVPRHLY